MLKQINITKNSRRKPSSTMDFPKQQFPSKHCSSFFRSSNLHLKRLKPLNSKAGNKSWLDFPMAFFPWRPNQKPPWFKKKHRNSPHPTEALFFCHLRFMADPMSLPCGLHRAAKFSNNLRPPEIEGGQSSPRCWSKRNKQKSNWNKRS